jgi:hypothetical protein
LASHPICFDGLALLRLLLPLLLLLVWHPTGCPHPHRHLLLLLQV